MVQLIAHGIIIKDKKILLIKRSEYRNGKINFNGGRWDVPGGSVKERETPREAVVRETREEVNCDVVIQDLLYEVYQYDVKKNKEFLTLIYCTELIGHNNEIMLNEDEHTEYCWVSIDEILNKTDRDILEYVYACIRVMENGRSLSDR